MQKAKALKIPNEKKWIEIGDYVYDDVCFEAKSATDFLGSVMSKRLWTQLDNMDRHYKTNIVIIHGDMQEAILNIIEQRKTEMKMNLKKYTNRLKTIKELKMLGFTSTDNFGKQSSCVSKPL